MGGHTDQGLLAFIYLIRTADFCHSHDAPGPGICFPNLFFNQFVVGIILERERFLSFLASVDWVRHPSGLASKSRGNKAFDGCQPLAFLFPWAHITALTTACARFLRERARARRGRLRDTFAISWT